MTLKGPTSEAGTVILVVLVTLALTPPSLCWGGGTLSMTVLEAGLTTACLGNVIHNLGCTQPPLGGVQGCSDPGNRTLSGDGPGGVVLVQSLQFDLSSRRRGGTGLELHDLVRRQLQSELVDVLRQQYRERRSISDEEALSTSDFGDSGLLADLFGSTSVGALTFTKLPDTASTDLFQSTTPLTTDASL